MLLQLIIGNEKIRRQGVYKWRNIHAKICGKRSNISEIVKEVFQKENGDFWRQVPPSLLLGWNPVSRPDSVFVVSYNFQHGRQLFL